MERDGAQSSYKRRAASGRATVHQCTGQAGNSVPEGVEDGASPDKTTWETLEQARAVEEPRGDRAVHVQAGCFAPAGPGNFAGKRNQLG